MGFFDSIQEHGMTSIIFAFVLVMLNLAFSNFMADRSIHIETITKARNENIEKIRTLIAENLQKSYKVKDSVYSLFKAHEDCIVESDCKESSKKFHSAKSDYYKHLYDYKYSHDLLLLYIKSIDPLMDTKKMEKLFDDLMASTTINIKEISSVQNSSQLNQMRYEYKKKYGEKTTQIKNEAAEFIKNWLEESYSEVLGKRKYNRLKN